MAGVKIHYLDSTLSRQMTMANTDIATITSTEALVAIPVELTNHITPTIYLN